MNYLYNDLQVDLHTTVEKALSEIGLKNFRIIDFSRGATYPTPEDIYFKIYTGDSSSSAYFSINTRTDAVYNNGNFEFSIKISANVMEDYTISYINGGYHNTNKQLDSVIEDKEYSLGSTPIIDIEEYGADWNGWNWGGTDTEAEVEYTKQTGSTLTIVRDGNHIDYKEAQVIINKAVSILHNYIIENKETIIAKLNTDTIYDHLDEFEHLYPNEWENIKAGDEPVYYRCGNYEFRLMRKDELDDIKYNVPYGTLIGYRRYLRFDNAIYVWFGGDQVCSLDC